MLNAAYLPRDERFSALKFKLFGAAALGSFGRDVIPTVTTMLGNTKPFKTFNQIHELYHGDLKVLTQPKSSTKAGSANVRDETPISFPRPGVVAGILVRSLSCLSIYYCRVQKAIIIINNVSSW